MLFGHASTLVSPKNMSTDENNLLVYPLTTYGGQEPIYESTSWYNPWVEKSWKAGKLFKGSLGISREILAVEGKFNFFVHKKYEEMWKIWLSP